MLCWSWDLYKAMKVDPLNETSDNNVLCFEKNRRCDWPDASEEWQCYRIRGG